MFESASFRRFTSASATKVHGNAEMCHLAVSREKKGGERWTKRAAGK